MNVQETNKFKYKELIKLVEDNGLTFRAGECYDSQSGWTGKNYCIYDGDTCLLDMSGNGYCFTDKCVDLAIDKIRAYVKKRDIATFEDFKSWLDDNSQPLLENTWPTLR